MSSASAPDTKRAILELSGAGFGYSGKPFISALDMQVREGDFIALLGANGSGKSTVLRLLAGITRPSEGSAALWDKPLGSYNNRDRAKLLSLLPQWFDMNVPFRVSELVRMGLYPYDIPTGMSAEDAMAVVGLYEKRDTPLRELSGGERRRAYIAMTLVQGAGIVLLDEPLANLDIRYQLELVRLLKQLNRERAIAIVMALHDVGLAMSFDRVVLLKDGSVLADGTADDTVTPALLQEAFGVSARIVGAGAIEFGQGEG